MRAGTRGRLGLAVLAIALATLGLAATAQAAVLLNATTQMPAAVYVGQANVPATITLTNASTPPHAGGTAFLCNAGGAAPCTADEGIVFDPACTAIMGSSCAPLGQSPGAFAVTQAVGASTGACQDVLFSIAALGAGRYRLTPVPAGTAIALPGSGAACTIRLVLRIDAAPAGDIDGAAGQQSAALIRATGYIGLDAATSAGASNLTTTHPGSVVPDTAIGGGPGAEALINTRTPTFGFATTIAGSTYSCTLDGSGPFACPQTYTTPELGDGQHLLTVAALSSPHGFPDLTPVVRRFTVDATAPETTIVSGPPDGAVLNYDTPLFAWRANETATFSCRIDDVPIARCEDAFATATPPGPHSFSVAATDTAGNVDPTPARRSFTIATDPALATPGCAIDGTIFVGSARADVRRGGPRSDVMSGGGGRDILRGLGGRDCVYGDGGDDRLFGGTSGDVVHGGSGNDRVLGEAGDDTVDGQAGNDVVDGGPGRDRVTGGSGNDQLAGGAGNDRLSGGLGADRLSDRSGRDAFDGGPGNDTVDARDILPAGRRTPDAVRCGAGRFDVALVDRRDVVAADCERVSRRPGRG